MDGQLIPHGRSLRGLTAFELCNFTYSWLVRNIEDPKQRARFEASIRGQLGSHGGYIINDPALPASMQGKEAPSWWELEDDPFEDQQSIGGNTTPT